MATTTGDATRDGASGHGVRAEALAALVALVVVLVVEVVARVGLGASADEAHIAATPDRLADARAAADSSGADSVVLLGNSTTREGLDPDALAAELDRHGRPAEVVAVHPDDTTLPDWVAAWDHLLADRPPDLLVLAFVGAQVQDGLPRDLSRTARDYTSWSELLDRLGEAEAVDDVLELAAARASDLYGHREDVSRRVLDLLPGYREVARRANDAARAGDAGDDEGSGGGCCTYRELTALVEEVGPERVVVLALPTRSPEAPDPALATAVRRSGARFVDATAVDGIDEKRFADPLHLDAEGRAIMTAFLADALLDAPPP